MLPLFPRLGRVIGAGTLTMLAAGSLAYAQPALRPYVGASVGSFAVSADEVDGRSASTGLFGGIGVSRSVDVEFDATFPTDNFTRSYSGVSVSFAPPGSSRAEIERLGVVTRFDKEREVLSNISVVVVIHPAGDSRVKPGFIAGVTNQRARMQTVYTPISIPDGVDPTHPAVAAHVERSTRNLGGPAIGGQLSIRVTPHFFVVPDVRYDYGSIGDEINNALRTSVRLHWRF
jgi:Outer membrane protein beta-barrel domain